MLRDYREFKKGEVRDVHGNEAHGLREKGYAKPYMVFEGEEMGAPPSLAKRGVDPNRRVRKIKRVLLKPKRKLKKKQVKKKKTKVMTAGKKRTYKTK